MAKRDLRFESFLDPCFFQWGLYGWFTPYYIKIGKFQFLLQPFCAERRYTFRILFMFSECYWKTEKWQCLLNHKDSVLPRTLNLKKIESDVADLYTRSMFYKIQNEISASSGDMEIVDINVEGDMKTVKLKDLMYKMWEFEVSLTINFTQMLRVL